MIAGARWLPDKSGWTDQRGSALVEFVLVAPLVLILFAAVIQVCLVVHVRSTLVAAAAEGARVGARVGAGANSAQDRARAAAESSLAAGLIEAVYVRKESDRGSTVVAVQIKARLPLFGLLGPSVLDVTGHALQEGA